MLLEDTAVTVRPEVVERDHAASTSSASCTRSRASNDRDAAWAKLTELGLADVFLYPQINWNSKSGSIEQIAKSLNIGLDAIAFVDDQQFERAEVAHVHPSVLTRGRRWT